ncbi:MAG: saccharopine dehydrogenase, partial [Chloroflexi bacterium]|nr:saccharopine dehydrogenase [Chloroflexota bacterium]
MSTAWWSTGIENIEAYYRAGRKLPQLMRLSRWFGWLLAGRTAQALLGRWIDRGPEGPSDAERRTSEGILVAEIEDARGRRVAARMRVPDPYG